MRKLHNNELNRLNVEEFRGAEKIPCIVVLDNVRSLNNIGSVFRTSDAFRVESIFLCGITATPPHRDIHKTALGATDTVSWEYFLETRDAIKKLKAEQYRILSVEQVDKSTSLENLEIRADQKTALVFGHEVKGVSQEVIDLSDACIDIPQYGTKHSLNISVCAGIVIWEVFKKYAKKS
ncbi:MAG: RNA methyltransferase [Bacteroidota bacterium]